MIKQYKYLVFALFWLSFSSLAIAHSPDFGQRFKVDHPDYGSIEYTQLFGDGIFWVDPVKVVVIDPQGYLLAATPTLEVLKIHCEQTKQHSTCQVYDELNKTIFEPNFGEWSQGRLISENGRPLGDAYPERMNIAYGFTQRSATVWESLTFEAIGIANDPVVTFLASVWWTVALSFLFRVFWIVKSNRWKVFPMSWRMAVFCVFAAGVFLGMSYLAGLAWLVAPYSSYYFAFVFLVGGFIAVLLARLRTAFVSLPI